MTDTSYYNKACFSAFYLPQCHLFSNERREGFAEWIDMGKARPLFKGYEQPSTPVIWLNKRLTSEQSEFRFCPDWGNEP